MRRTLLALALAACSRPAPVPTAATPVARPAAAPALETLAPDQVLHGFRVVARYRDDAGKAKGARFVHEATGFELDLLAIDSAPQGFLWVRTYPTSDAGEPHTQEHLVLGKGKKGRSVANLEEMTRSESTAFTAQWYTAYPFNTPVAASYFPTLEAALDGLLNPDYTDEEIRREVRNFGVTTQRDGALVLEEKGTVYQEMTRSYEQPIYLVFRAAEQHVYGAAHPLSWSAGGWPEAIRAMTAEDIRRFHADHYHLGNMGLITSLPPSVPLAEALERHAAVLGRLAGRRGPVFSEEELPRPRGAAPGTIEITEFPSASAATPGFASIVWPATRDLPVKDKVLLDLFLDAMAGDESTELYKLLIDSKTRVLDTGATSIGAFATEDQGMPVTVLLSDVPPRTLTPERLAEIRAQVVGALRRVAEAQGGSPEVEAVNRRVRSRLTDLRRGLAKAAGSPPGFGNRSGSAFWMEHLVKLARGGGFERSLTLRPELDAIEAELAGKENPWRRAVQTFRLLDVEPGVVAVRASPALLERLTRERDERVAAETRRLMGAMGAKDAADALARFRAAADAEGEKIEAAAATELPPLADALPMTADDALRAAEERVAGVPVVAATFDGMVAAEVGLAFRLDVVPEEDLLAVALLPALLRETGIAGGKEVVPYDEMTERLRREVLGLEVELEAHVKRGRVELIVRASGNDLEESRQALAWMGRILTAPDWRVENLPRLTDLVAREAAGLRQTLRGGEEGWAYRFHDSVLMQRSPPFLRASSFLTRAHDAHRLRWLLEDAGPHREAVTRFLGRLAPAGKLGRAKLERLVAAMQKPAPVTKDARPYLAAFRALPEGARAVAVKAAADLHEILDEIPDEALARDFAYLCEQIAADLARPPAETLAALARVRALVVRSGNARGWIASSAATRAALAPELAALLERIAGPAPARPPYADRPLVLERIQERGGKPAAGWLGLLNRSTAAGLVLTSVPSAGHAERDEEALLRYLAGNLYAGHGSHGMFMKTWGAGLAYSNGIRPSLPTGRLGYYAERSPRLPQTLRFVAGELERARPGARLADYAVAQAFDSRVADSYEERARRHAQDLADGDPPEEVRAFRERLLALRKRPDLGAALAARLVPVVGQVVPGLGPASLRARPDAVYVAAGPESQLRELEEHLREADGGTPLTRIYPRDFWVVR
jgi:Zn-dependent M16 (insulinase) family peptidase